MIGKFKNVKDFTHAMLDIFNNEIEYRYPFGKAPILALALLVLTKS